MSSTPPSDKKAGPRITRIPDGDDRARLVCPDCNYVAYVNPRVIVGAVSTWDGKFLLAKRAIEPRKGFWTLPAGFLEMGETLEAGAVRETWEEARARIKVDGLLGIYNVARIGEVHMFFRGHMLSPDFAAGPESEAVDLYAWEDIPWDELAFPSIFWSLKHYQDVVALKDFAPRTEPAGMHWGNFEL